MPNKIKKEAIIKSLSLALLIGSPIIAFTSCSITITIDRDVTIKLFHTSDIHGYLMDTSSNDESTFQYRLAYIAKKVNDARNNKQYDDLLLLDGGDVYQGQIVSNFTNGSALRAALDWMHYDATTLGNHEFDWGLNTNCTDWGTIQKYELNEQYKNDNPTIPVLAANIYEKGTKNHIKYTQEYTIVNKANKRIALIGYVPNYSADIMAEKIAPYDIDEDLDHFSKTVKEINNKENPDMTIVMCHANPIPVANKLSHDDVDLVTGGHDHNFRNGISDTNVSYIQGGWYGQGYASVSITIKTNHEVIVHDRNLVNVVEKDKTKLYDNDENKNNLDNDILNISHYAWNETAKEMNKEVGYITKPIEKTKIDKNGTASTAGNWITNLYKEATETDIAFYNTSGIRVKEFAIPDGADRRMITLGDLNSMLPFGNPLLIYEFSAKDLEQQLINGLTGANFGDQMSGLTFTYTQDGDNFKILSMKLADGTEIDVNNQTKRYKVCLSKYSATLEGSVTKNMASINNEQTALTEIDAVINALEKKRKALGVDTKEFLIEVDTSSRGTKVSE